MHARTIELYFLPSLTQLMGEDPLALIEKPDRRAFLTKWSDEAAVHVQRRNACGEFLLQVGCPGQSARDRFDMVFSGSSAQLRPTDDGLLLVIDCADELGDCELQQVLDLGDFGLAIASEGSENWAEPARGVRHAALTALVLSGFEGAIDGCRPLGAAKMAIESESGRPIYIITPRMGRPTITGTSALLPDQATEAAKLASALTKAPKNLGHVARLLSQSHESRSHSLLAFISAWAGLEIMIGSTFERYETLWSSAINGAVPKSALSTASRMRTVMKDKYRLGDKFSIMASVLDPDWAERDVAAFVALKKVRDAFFHGLATDPQHLPVVTTRQLLQKYLSLHLQQM